MLKALLGFAIGIVAMLAAPRSAHAQDGAATSDAMEDYFAGEKRGGMILVAMGVGGLVAGGLLYRSSSSTARGASYPFLGVGLVHAAAGIYVYLASDGRIDDFNAQIAEDPAAFVDRESERMKGVSTQFTVLKIVEGVLIAGGLTMAAIGHKKERFQLKGAGLALALEAALTLGFDLVAARRASDYRAKLAAVDVSASVDPDGGPTLLLSRSGTF